MFLTKNNNKIDFLFIIPLFLFLIQKTILYKYDGLFVFIYIFFFILSLFKKDINYIIYYILILLTNNSYMIIFLQFILVCIVVINVIYSILHKNRASKRFIVFFLTSLYFLLNTLFNYVNIYSLVRTILLIGSPAIFFLVIKQNIFKNKNLLIINMGYVFLTLWIAQLLNPTYLNRVSLIHNSSMSLFALIFLMFFYIKFDFSKRKFINTILYILAFIPVFLSGSRSGTLFFVLGYFFFMYKSSLIKEKRYFNFFLLILFLSSLFIFFKYDIGNDLMISNDLLKRSYIVVDDISGIEKIYKEGIRYSLLMEGLTYFKNIFDVMFGVGAVVPKIIKSSSFHDSYLDFILSYGLIGFILIFLQYYYIIKYFPKKIYKSLKYLILLFYLFNFFQPYLFNVVSYSFMWVSFIIYSSCYSFVDCK